MAIVLRDARKERGGLIRSLFARKPIAELLAEGENPQGLRRALGAGDLIMLAIGAVIGAGIFGSIGSAAAGQVDAAGNVIRVGAGPALVVSFVLLGAACALAGLCYAELASMIPQAGSAYAYSYATLGELVAWIIGWDLILEYAVGNVAVAISWGDYFKSLVGDWISIPVWLTTGYRTALLSSNPDVHGLLQNAPQIGGIPILINVPAFAIVAFITWLLLLGVRESARANNIMVAVKLLVLALFIIMGTQHINTANYHPFAPNGFKGIHQGAAIVFFAYIGFDAISTAAEETKNPQRNLPIGILGGLAICTVIYVIIGVVLTGMVPSKNLGTAADPLAYALNATGMTNIAKIVALGAVFSMAAVLLVFQYGQPRIFFAMARDGLLPHWASKVHGRYRTPYITTILTGIFVALWSLIGDAGETYDLTNIGTLFAFALVCIGVMVLRHTDPERPRPFRVPVVYFVAPVGAALCVFVMRGLPHLAWVRFGWWLAFGLLLYALYGYWHSTLRRRTGPVPIEPPPPISA
ncbi:MAG: amino acid permease [Gemmatimonadetes bacterium]|nr:MAG: amino acid permease [Gemmatimonadota bacterium]PYP50900.1 MAG: amino acid permease [Gemmatimonadota bacterium]